ncbi:MAG: EAL domain-containing protein [Fimbriimonadaceae bacterium]
MQNDILRTSNLAAKMVSPMLHQQLKSEDDYGSVPYDMVSNRLQQFLESHTNITYVYTMVQRDGQIYFVVDPTQPGDADGDGIEDKSYPFEPYENATPAMLRAFATKAPSVEKEPTTDSWGTQISGYSPVFDSEGNFVCVVGVDLDYSEYSARTAWVHQIFTLFNAISLIISFAVGLLVARLNHRIANSLEHIQEQKETLDLTNEELSKTVHQLDKKARTDFLTGLLNRETFEEVLEQSMGGQSNLTLLFLDLDNFKLINDAYGHDTGDQLLKLICGHIQDIGDGAVIGRFGGDEFLLFVTGENAKLQAEKMAENILQRLSRPIFLNGRRIIPTASIGLVTCERGSCQSFRDILRRADAAMYAAKKAGKNQWAEFNVSMEQELFDKVDFNEKMLNAWDDGEFHMVWQPVINLETGIAEAAEGLMRWTTADGEPITPSQFIPVAEENGLIIKMGDRAIRAACEQLCKWESSATMHEICLTVNVSAKQIGQQDFVEKLKSHVEETGIDPRKLVIEVTESLLIADVDLARITLEKVRKLGVRVALDDFGTGYSSLSVLVSLPIDILKIDRAFVTAMEDDARSLALTKTVLSLGQNLELKVVAEGIETSFHEKTLLGLKCQYGQGFLFAPGLRAEQLEELVRDIGSEAA